MNVNSKDFEEEVINSTIPVLVDFWTSWCPPCKMMEYILNELEEEYGEKIKIVKINVDRNRVIPRIYEITGVPTYMLFKDGQIMESFRPRIQNNCGNCNNVLVPLHFIGNK